MAGKTKDASSGRRNRTRIRVVPRITPDGLIFGMVVAATAVLGLVAGNNFILLVACLLLSAFLLSAWYPLFSLRWIDFERKPPDDIVAGRPARFLVALSRKSGLLPAYAIRVEDLGKGASLRRPGVASVLRLRPGRTGRASYEVRFLRRGRYQDGRFALNTSFPFGFFRARLEGVSSASFVVYPKLRYVRFPVPGSLLAGVDRPSRTYFGGDAEFKRLREYQPGDNPRTIHWKSTARHGKLMVRDEERYERKKATVILDTHESSHRRRLKRFVAFERSVSLAASLAVMLERQGYLYRLVMPCREEAASDTGRGDDHLRSVLTRLALVQPGADEPLDALLRRVQAGQQEEAIVIVQEDPSLAGLSGPAGRFASLRVIDASRAQTGRGGFGLVMGAGAPAGRGRRGEPGLLQGGGRP